MGAGKNGKRYRMGAESGVSLSGLIVVLVVLGALALLVIKVVPAYIEYRAVKSAVVKAKADGSTAREIQQSFDKNADINNVEAIKGSDLVISRDSGQIQVSFAYEKRIPLAGNVSLLIDFAGSTDPGATAVKADTAAQ